MTLELSPIAVESFVRGAETNGGVVNIQPPFQRSAVPLGRPVEFTLEVLALFLSHSFSGAVFS